MPRSLALLCVVLLAFAGCTANIPDGRFHCIDDNGCPNGLHCHADRLCYHAADDAGGGGNDAAMPDGGSTMDAGSDAGSDAGPAMVDAATCTAADCITLTVTNAHSAFAAGLTFSIEGGGFTMPAYGETSDAFDVSLGDGMLDVMSSLFGTVLSLPATGHSAYALVVGHDPSPANLSPVLRLLPLSFVAPTPGTFRVYPIDMMQESSALALTVASTTRRIDPATDGGVLMLPSSKRTPIQLNRYASDGVSPDVMLAAFDASELPQDGAYYVVLVGNPSVHLAADTGLRMIPITPGMHLYPSWPVVFALNAASDPVAICDGSTPIATPDPMTLVQGFPSFDVTTSAGMTRTLALTATNCADADTRPVSLPVPDTTMVSGRVLLAIEGLVGTPMWGGGAHFEAPPASAATVQVITYGNGSNSMSASFGSTSTGIRAPGTPPIGAAFAEWTTRPTDLLIDYSGTMFTYAWDPTSSSAAIFFVTDDATNHVAFELDSAFGKSWALNIHVPM